MPLNPIFLELIEFYLKAALKTPETNKPGNPGYSPNRRITNKGNS